MQSSESGAYDGDGKTTVSVINTETHLNLINSYSARGFRLSNNIFIFGSILVFPTHVYSWGVRRGKEITPESLVVFDLIVPKAKIVVIGYGEHGEPNDPTIVNHLKSRGISCEFLPTPHAITTYNFLVNDSVHVAGAFVPVIKEVKMTSSDVRLTYEQDRLFSEREYNLDPSYERAPRADDNERIKDLKREKKTKFDE